MLVLTIGAVNLKLLKKGHLMTNIGDGSVCTVLDQDGRVVFRSIKLGAMSYGPDQRHWVPKKYLPLFDAVVASLDGDGVVTQAESA